MKTNNPAPQRTPPELLGAFLVKPSPLAHAADQAMIEVVTALAAGELSGEDLKLARRVCDEDPAAAVLYRHLTEGAQVAAKSTPDDAVRVQAFFEALTRELRALFSEFTVPKGALGDGLYPLGASGKNTRVKSIPIGGATATLKQIKRPDGFYEIEIVVPAAADVDPAQLTGFGLKVVDRPGPLRFKRRRNGNFVATAALLVEGADKEITIVRLPPEGLDRAPATD